MKSNVSAVKGVKTYDIAVIGGGVNGTAIARDAAGRGYSVVLFERGDLACATSSASTKLIHGGLRYLEYGELRLVKKALKEREVFLKTAPHIVSPMRFVLPVSKNTRPAWMINIGLSLYDHLARRDVLPNAEKLDFKTHETGKPLLDNFENGFAYSDCWVDDARLVVLQAVDAARNGAHIFTNTPVRDITAQDGIWDIETETDARVQARFVVNAAGPWVRKVLDDNRLSVSTTPDIRLVRGSHIVVPALYEGEQSYLMQQPDGRVVFAIPFEGKFTLIGTTDVEHDTGVDGFPVCTEVEAAYLCDAANRYFNKQTQMSDIFWSYSGVRPLFDDGKGRAQAVTRDYHLYKQRHSDAPILSVYGGKITTARALAESAVDTIEKDLGQKARAWTQNAPLPGGDMIDCDFEEYVADVAAIYHWFDAQTLVRYARSYGTWMTRILGGATHIGALGRDFGSGLYEAEVNYLRRVEWARTSEDILWRRSKLGLHVSLQTVEALKRYLGEQ